MILIYARSCCTVRGDFVTVDSRWVVTQVFKVEAYLVLLTSLSYLYANRMTE